MAAWTVWIFLMNAVITIQGSTSTECGMAPLNNKIVGGVDVTPGAWPWQASVHIHLPSYKQHYCGGTLISDQWVLTAAHCIITTYPGVWLVYLGKQGQSGSNPDEVNRTVSEIIVHPDYNNTLFNNDIALMQLSSPVTFNDYIRPICLASNTSQFHTISCWATGWGKLGSNEPIQDDQVLQEVQIPVVGNKECSCNYTELENVNITGKMICAGEVNKGICQGDSGGPLQCKEGAQWVQAGITSFGVPCALGGYPEVYVRLSEFQDWIIEKAGANVSFVTFTSSGTDPNDSFTCSRSSFQNTNTTSTASTVATELTLAVSLVTVFLQYTVAP